MERSFTPTLAFFVHTLSFFCLTNLYAANPSEAAAAAILSGAAASTPENIIHIDHQTTKKSLGKAIDNARRVRGDQFILTDKKLVKTLNAMPDGSATLILNKSSAGHAEMAEKRGSDIVRLLPHVHSKIWCVTEKDAPPTPKPKKTKKNAPETPPSLLGRTATIGSANASEAAHRNFELTLQTNNPKTCGQLVAWHDNPPDTPTKEQRKVLLAIKDTPLKQRAYHSFTTPLNASRVARINKAISEKIANPAQNISIFMCTMNINDKNTLSSLTCAASIGIQVFLYLDKESLSGPEKITMLKECSDVGVNIFIFDPYYTGSAIMHTKLFLRTIGEQHCMEITTANATDTGDSERNHSVLIPNPQIEEVMACHTHMSAIRDASTAFKDIDFEKSAESRTARKKKPQKASAEPETSEVPIKSSVGPALKKTKRDLNLN